MKQQAPLLDEETWMDVLFELHKKHLPVRPMGLDEDAWKDDYLNGKSPEAAFFSEYPEYKPEPQAAQEAPAPIQAPALTELEKIQSRINDSGLTYANIGSILLACESSGATFFSLTHWTYHRDHKTQIMILNMETGTWEISSQSLGETITLEEMNKWVKGTQPA